MKNKPLETSGPPGVSNQKPTVSQSNREEKLWATLSVRCQMVNRKSIKTTELCLLWFSASSSESTHTRRLNFNYFWWTTWNCCVGVNSYALLLLLMKLLITFCCDTEAWICMCWRARWWGQRWSKYLASICVIVLEAYSVSATYAGLGSLCSGSCKALIDMQVARFFIHSLLSKHRWRWAV